MRIGGFQPVSLIDYPGKIAAIIFTQGCNFRCGYCYNPQLVCPKQFQVPMEESYVLEFLESRKGKLQGVVLCGGEPTIQKGLVAFLAKLKSMGYAIKLDTNGSFPEVLSSLIDLGLVNFIAMDIKSSWVNYEKAAGVGIDVKNIKASIHVIQQSGLPHQFRTVLVKPHCSIENLQEIQGYIGSSKNYMLKTFFPLTNILDKSLLDQEQYSQEEVRLLRRQFQQGH